MHMAHGHGHGHGHARGHAHCTWPWTWNMDMDMDVHMITCTRELIPIHAYRPQDGGVSCKAPRRAGGGFRGTRGRDGDLPVGGEGVRVRAGAAGLLELSS